VLSLSKSRTGGPSSSFQDNPVLCGVLVKLDVSLSNTCEDQSKTEEEKEKDTPVNKETPLSEEETAKLWVSTDLDDLDEDEYPRASKKWEFEKDEDEESRSSDQLVKKRRTDEPQDNKSAQTFPPSDADSSALAPVAVPPLKILRYSPSGQLTTPSTQVIVAFSQSMIPLTSHEELEKYHSLVCQSFSPHKPVLTRRYFRKVLQLRQSQREGLGSG